MTTHPLTYPCLQTVLEHMEPSLRISFSLHAPSIRLAEKATPMKIDNLQIDCTMIKINNTQYKLGVVQIYNGDDKPDQIEKDNSTGGVPYDLNNHGVPDYSFEDVLLPGDILIAQDREGDEQRRAAQFLHLRAALRAATIRLRLEKRAENPPIPQEVQEVQEDDVIQPNAAWVDSQYEIWNRMDAVDCKFIESNQWSVLPHQLQEDGGVYPFENYLQFTKSSEGSESSKSLERLTYTKKLPEAMKHLLNQILGNRKKNLHVKNFKPADTGILRVPQGFKLTTLKIQVGKNLAKTLHAL
ncbi:hypothetical protein GCK72_004013 [Caenorhabditis remanei]|uniref:Uncharacterized protein n=1 Tax=Caenorhabditis remanei TaxID=31234 RepID=A0A6A5HA74_CAERE|nr:hypothetical protein GCK72_004013 [Caenorhabditis remanei]KAF1764067.1 hypothetical protein GCK72_004013 [Caenorhabditis remanei]